MGTAAKTKPKDIKEYIKKFVSKFWPFLVVIGACLLFSYPYLLFGKVPFPSDYLVDFFAPWNNYYGLPVKNNAMSDVINQIYPWKIITIESLQLGQLPKWNPYQFSGTPHMANYQSAVFSPFNVLFFVLPFIDAWSVLILLQPLLAGMFMLLYLKELSMGKYAQTVGALSFMFGGYMTVWMAYGTLGYALLFLPLILFGVERLAKNNSAKYIFLVGFATWLSLVSGHFQISFYVSIVAFVYLLFRSFTAKSIQLGVKGLIGILMGYVAASPQLIASYDLYSLSARSEAFAKGAAVPLSQLITLFAPDYYGNPVTRNDWRGLYAEFAMFAGTVGLFLGLFAVYVKRSVFVVFYSFLVVGAFLMTIDSILIDTIVSLKIPFISTSYFSRLLSIVLFSISVLSGLGTDALISSINNNQNGNKLIVFAVFALLFVLVLWIDLLSGFGLFMTDNTPEHIHIAMRNMRLPTLLLFGVIGLLSLYSINRIIKKKIPVVIFGIVIVSLVFVDMYRYSAKWMPFDTRAHMYPSLELIEYLQENAGEHRVSGHIANESLAPFGLYGVEGYDPLYIARYGELVRSGFEGEKLPAERSVVQFPDTGRYSKDLMDLLGVKYFVHSVQDEQRSYVFPFWQYPDSFGRPVWTDDTYEVYENKSVFDRAFIVYDYVVAESDQNILDLMYNPDTDLQSVVILEKDPELSIEDCEATSSEVIIESYTPNTVIIGVNSDCPGFLVLTDSYYPEWKAHVDGKSIEMYRANYALRAVPVPSGESQVVFSI